MSQAEKGEHSRSYASYKYEFHVMFAGVVPLLFLLLYSCCAARVINKLKGVFDSNRPGCCVQVGVPTKYAHAYTQMHRS